MLNSFYVKNLQRTHPSKNFVQGDGLALQLGHFPRVQLATLPTPLEEMANLSQYLDGPRILIKRDDLTGLATGGNKTRKLEFLLGDALHQRADVIVTGANTQSNHVRQTAAAVKKLGISTVLLLSGEKPSEITGNLLLDKIFGAEIRFVGGTEEDLPRKIDQVAQELTTSGRNPYAIKHFGSNPIGTLGYVNTFGEILYQANQEQLKIDHLIVSGGGGTQAGLCLCEKAMNAQLNIIGIAISRQSQPRNFQVAMLANETATHMGLDLRIEPDEITIIPDYAGDGFAIPTNEMVEAVKLVAQTEGILLDPVYTGKVMAGLIDLIRKDIFQKEDTVLFIHTGGIPALFVPQYRKLFIENY